MVVVTARANDWKLCALLRGSCGTAVSMLLLETDCAFLSGDAPDIVFTALQRDGQIGCENAIFVVRDKNCLPAQAVCTNAVAVVDSANRAVMELVAARRLPALTCGLAGADTFTLSSFTRDSAVISLQRQITAFDGTPVEPFELPVTFTAPVEPFTLLACAAVFCMLGAKSPLANATHFEMYAAKTEPAEFG